MGGGDVGLFFFKKEYYILYELPFLDIRVFIYTI
jgi:hypothetical protein